jgi:hypothetical protein
MLEDLLNLAHQYKDLLFIIGIISIVLFLLTLIFVPVIVVNLRADHFVRAKDAEKKQRSVFSVIFYIGKNSLGILLLLLGLLLIVLPGPGWLTILAGIALVDFPFKHKLELKILTIPVVCKAINHYRTKHKKPPLIFPSC